MRTDSEKGGMRTDREKGGLGTDREKKGGMRTDRKKGGVRTDSEKRGGMRTGSEKKGDMRTGSMRAVIYQIFTRLYGADSKKTEPWGERSVNGCGRMADIDTKAIRRIRELGFTHIWATGIIRHATCTRYDNIPDCNPKVVKGLAGSPYAITDYYDIDPDIAVDTDKRLQEFDALVKRIHKAGMRIVTDFVPNHVSREYHSICAPEGVKDLGDGDDTNVTFSPGNNFYYIPGERLHIDGYDEYPARATGNDVFHAWPGNCDWYETVKLNYGVDYSTGQKHFDPLPDTWRKMTDILLYWASKGVDAFRCDMAEMVPVEFWQYAIAEVKNKYRGIEFIAEVYNPQMYRDYIWRGGFDYLYDKVGLYDCVRDVMCGRRWAGEITHAWQAVDDISEHMLGFLENHDEQRIASAEFAGNAHAGRAGMIATAAVSKAPVMIYMGQEIGEAARDAEGYSGKDGRTTIFDYWTVDTIRRQRKGRLTDEEQQLQDFYKRLLRACNESEALREGSLYDLMYVNPPSEKFDAEHIYVCLRHTANELLLIVANFADRQQEASIEIPPEAFQHIGLAATEQPVCWQDLLSDYSVEAPLQPNVPITVSLQAQHGVILAKR